MLPIRNLRSALCSFRFTPVHFNVVSSRLLFHFPLACSLASSAPCPLPVVNLVSLRLECVLEFNAFPDAPRWSPLLAESVVSLLIYSLSFINKVIKPKCEKPKEIVSKAP